MATAQADLARMPEDLRERGWKLERKVVNDDEQNPDYVAHNAQLRLRTEAFPLVSRAIAEARKLEEGKITLPPAHETPVEPVTEKSFDDEMSAVRAMLKEDGASGPRMISHSLFRLDGGTQPREQLDQAVIVEYAEAKKRGDVFPPVDVFFDDEWMWLAGGFHRYFSDKLLGLNETLANVHYGTQRDAVLFSLHENATHGLPRSNADKRRAVLTMLHDPDWSKWSDNMIAAKVKVSQPFVSSLRRELESQNVLSDGDDAPPTPVTKRRGRDGLMRETKNIGRTARTIAAEVDIKVDDVKVDARQSQPRIAEPEGWSDKPINLHIQINAGKTAARAILVSGRHGDGKPVFRQFTFADLEPMPMAMAGIFGELKAVVKRAQPKTETKPQTTKPAQKKPARKK
jgi:hypothetical protein